MLYVLFSLDWRGHRPAPPPKVLASLRSQGAISAGAARIDLRPKLPAVVAGYPPKRPIATESGPLFARAIALRSGDKALGFVSAEVLEVPERVVAVVRERGRALGLADVVVTATHVHSSFGGYDPRLIAQIAALGSYHEESEAHLTFKLGEALEAAVRALKPATMHEAQVALSGVSANRDDPFGAIDERLTAIELDDASAAPIARLAIFGSHATLTPRDTTHLDGDWPGRAMAKLEEGGGVGLIMQGAVGDASSRPPEGDGAPADKMGGRVAQAVRDALQGKPEVAGQLAFAAIQFGVPRAAADHGVPGFLRQPAANVLHAMAPRKAEVAVVRLPGLTLLFVPVEPTAAAAQLVRDRITPLLGKDEALAIVSLAQGYLGYAEEPKAARDGHGEAKRMLFEPDLIERIATALVEGVVATTPKP
jgi:hypothetical protein